MPTDNLVAPSKEPKLDELLKEFQRSGGYCGSGSQSRIDNVRLAKWSGQTTDGKKHREALKKDPFPWEGASDSRIHFADEIINDLGDVLRSAFTKARLVVGPAEPGDIDAAGAATALLAHYRGRMGRRLDDEAELVWQYGLDYGASVWQVAWAREVEMQLATITKGDVDQIAAGYAQEDPNHPLANLGTALMDESKEDYLTDLMQVFAAQMSEQMGEPGGYGDQILAGYKLSKTHARKVVKDLRAAGEAKFPLPYVRYEGPRVTARKFGYDIFVSGKTTEIGKARVIHVAEWMSEEEVRAGVTTDDWDPAWVEAAVKCKGQGSNWSGAGGGREYTEISDLGSSEWQGLGDESDLIEVLHAYKRYVDDDGISQIWCTVYCPHALKDDRQNPIYAKHYLLGYAHGQYPFVEYRRERRDRRLFSSRGVPEITATWQEEVKRQVDMLGDRASIEIVPAVTISNRLGAKYRYGPGAQIPRMRADDVSPMAPVPGSPGLAFQTIDLVYARADHYFGRMSQRVPPAKWQARLQAMADRYLGSAETMWGQCFALILQHTKPEQVARITGVPVPLPNTPRQIVEAMDWRLEFDVSELDVDLVMKKLTAIMQIAVPLDQANRLDKTKLAEFAARAIDPAMARAITQKEKGADEKMYEQVAKELAFMALGNTPPRVENDPTAERKMGVVQMIIQGNPAMGIPGNKKYAEALAGKDPDFKELFEKYMQNLGMSVMQGKNAQTGKTGVAA